MYSNIPRKYGESFKKANYSPVLVIFMLIIFHDARNFPTFFKFLRWKITSIVSNVSTVTRVLYWTLVEKVGISLKDVITTILSKNTDIICWFSEVISKLVLFSKVLIIFHGARNFPTFFGFLHGILRARDCKHVKTEKVGNLCEPT